MSTKKTAEQLMHCMDWSKLENPHETELEAGEKINLDRKPNVCGNLFEIIRQLDHIVSGMDEFNSFYQDEYGYKGDEMHKAFCAIRDARSILTGLYRGEERK